MARYDVFTGRGGEQFLLDVQSDLLDVLSTRIVVPLLPAAIAPLPAARLNPVFHIGETEVVMMTQFLAAVPTSLLRHKRGSLTAEHDRIVAALDMAFHGF